MTGSSNNKNHLQTTQFSTPLASHQVHTNLAYFDTSTSYKLPSRSKSHWQCWSPAPQVSYLRSAKMLPCPPRITYGGVLQQRKAEQATTPAALAMRARKRKIIAAMPPLKRSAHHYTGVQQRNKRQLRFPVPLTQKKSSVREGKHTYAQPTE